MARPRTRSLPQKESYHHGDLRHALLESALAIVSEEGVHDLSLREVARRAGVTYAAPYHHFADKSALLAAVGAQGFEVLIRELERASSRSEDLRGQLLAMAEAYLAFARSHPSHYRVMFLPELKITDVEEYHRAGDRAFDMLVSRVKLARPGDPETAQLTVAATVWAALHGLSLLSIDGTLEHKFAKINKMLRQACGAIVRMVL
ncbi:MAG TPA: TetR/AcrR family transcriptional regulator [Polyangiaceae bacterium]|nr:TetR/AcrR family transcriptional regulator [Polyangiaceae bacterium]